MHSIESLTRVYKLDMEKPHPGGVDFEGRLFLYSLIQLYRPARVIEIGTSAGRSAEWLAAAALDCSSECRIVCVDKWGHSHGGKAEGPGLAKARLRLANVLRAVEFVSADSHKWLPKQEAKSADIVWVDGDHSYEGAMADVVQARRVASRLVIVHDTVILPDVRRACDNIGGGFHIDCERGFCLFQPEGRT